MSSVSHDLVLGFLKCTIERELLAEPSRLSKKICLEMACEQGAYVNQADMGRKRTGVLKPSIVSAKKWKHEYKEYLQQLEMRHAEVT